MKRRRSAFCLPDNGRKPLLLVAALLGCQIFVFFAIGTVLAQQPEPGPPAGARELFLMAVSRKDTLPPVRPTAAPAPGVVHLGLRYNLVLFKNGKPEPTPTDHILHAGDCFSIEFQANRSGYLYVLAKQSSGTWIPLLPSAEMPDENNILDPDKKIQIPKSYCFEIHDPPGTETLFVVLSRNPRDFYELYQGIKAKNTSPAPVQVAVAQLNDRFGSRDIAVRKVDQAVYVVNASNQPASSIVTEINVVHR